MIRREVAIVGIGQTAYARTLPGTAWELALGAVIAPAGSAAILAR